MGANAQTTVPTFTAGDVLTAAQMNQSARTGVPVFAGTVERDAAFGGTGEKTLAEGQLCYLESTNVVQYYDGSNWATVGPQTVASPGMVRITGASFTTAASVAFPNDTFTDTYRVYFVVFNILDRSTGQTVSLRVRDNSGSKSAANYTGQAAYWRAANGTNTFNNTLNATSQILGRTYVTVETIGLYVANPTNASERTQWWGQGTLKDTSDDPGANTIMGVYTVDEAHTGLEFFVTGTITGNYNVYGLADS